MDMKMPPELIDQGYKQIRDNDIEKVMWKNTARIVFGEK
jgi:hypothetical protein